MLLGSRPRLHPNPDPSACPYPGAPASGSAPSVPVHPRNVSRPVALLAWPSVSQPIDQPIDQPVVADSAFAFGLVVPSGRSASLALNCNTALV